MTFTILLALSGLTLSSVAIYYSVIGLTAIFAAAFWPIVVMGTTLEVSKLVAASWLKANWERIPLLMKTYMLIAVVVLMLITSMGIFGFLSKAHSDNSLVSGDVQAKIALYDEKIKTARENIDANRKVLKQMDEAVDQIMGRSTSETGADKAVAVRRSQQKERARLFAEIQAEQATVSKLSEERAPLAAELRKVEAEVGPIKYIAAMIYGDNPDANVLEKAVRWMIILLVLVFDPLAIALVLAANQSKEWDAEEKPAYEADDSPLTDDQIDQLKKAVEAFELPKGEVISKTELFPDIDEANRLIDELEKPEPEFEVPVQEQKTYVQGNYVVGTPTLSYGDLSARVIPEPVPEPIVEHVPEPVIEPEVIAEPKIDTPIATEGVSFEPYKVLGESGYVEFEGKRMHKRVLADMHPEFGLKVDGDEPIRTGFGTKFPELAFNGDIFVRVDALPNRVFKFNGYKWIEVNRDRTDTHLTNPEYIQFLIDKIASGEYDIDLLTDSERSMIEEHINGQN
jgi:hypothetical protein